MVFTMYTKETKRQSALEKARFIRAQNYNLKIQKTVVKRGRAPFWPRFWFFKKLLNNITK